MNEFGTFFWLDASALLKLVLEEQGSEQLKRVVEEAGCVYTTSFCFGEAFGILKVWRFGKQKRISQKVYIRATNHLRSCIKSNSIKFDEASILNSTVFFEAADLSDRYGVDLSDALQVVTIKRSRVEGATLITADKALAAAARKEGVSVWNCEKEAPPDPVF
jgi:predicted nucleic acid-binding protein